MIYLPNNGLGAAIMLIILFLVAIVPFSIVLWLASFAFPWWVSVPLAALASVVTWLTVVKFK